MLDSLYLVLARPRFPENIGMAARACANMGCPNLLIAAPERWDPLKSEPLATPKGMAILKKAKIHASLAEALAPLHCAYGATARGGGWRRGIRGPEQAAIEIAGRMAQGGKVALVLGPEDKGLDNADICLCDRLVRIPAASGATSLNLAQAALILLYECRKARLPAKPPAAPAEITKGEMALLHGELKKALLKLDCLSGANPDYFFLQWRSLLARARPARHELDALMGMCRQINNKLP